METQPSTPEVSYEQPVYTQPTGGEAQNASFNQANSERDTQPTPQETTQDSAVSNEAATAPQNADTQTPAAGGTATGETTGQSGQAVDNTAAQTVQSEQAYSPAPAVTQQAPAAEVAPEPPAPAPQLSQYDQAVEDLTSNIENISLAATAPPQCGDGATPACDVANGLAQTAQGFNEAINADQMIQDAAAAAANNAAANQAVVDAAANSNAQVEKSVNQAQQLGDTTNAAIDGFDAAYSGTTTGQGALSNFGLGA